MRDFIKLIFVTTLGLTYVMCSAQSVIFVDQNASLGGDGKEWATAFRYLQDALQRASLTPTQDEIWVAEGIYYPDEDEGGNVTNGDQFVIYFTK